MLEQRLPREHAASSHRRRRGHRAGLAVAIAGWRLTWRITQPDVESDAREKPDADQQPDVEPDAQPIPEPVAQAVADTYLESLSNAAGSGDAQIFLEHRDRRKPCNSERCVFHPEYKGHAEVLQGQRRLASNRVVCRCLVCGLIHDLGHDGDRHSAHRSRHRL